MRLLQAENIYKMPAVYKCPMISVPTLSYSYEEAPKEPDGVVTCNNFDEQDITEILKAGGRHPSFLRDREPAADHVSGL